MGDQRQFTRTPAPGCEANEALAGKGGGGELLAALSGRRFHRFFLDHLPAGRDEWRLPAPVAHQVGRVLRLRPGDHVVLLAEDGCERLAELCRVQRGDAWVRLVAQRPCRPEPRREVVLALALIAREPLEWAIQKATELGVAHIRLLRTERTLAPSPDPSRLQRWRSIAREAAEQCGRGRVPTIAAPVALAEFWMSPGAGAVVVLGEHEQELELHRALPSPFSGVTLVVGPEGGFTRDEIAAARAAGASIASLGPRQLRAETAAVAALTLVLESAGELAPVPPAPWEPLP